MIVMGALGTVSNRSKAMNSAIASMIIIYVFVFNLAWGGLAWSASILPPLPIARDLS